jgi:hypothetical protein
MRYVRGATAIFVALLTGTSAIAASVEVVQGQVSLNRGSGYAKVSGITQANAGDVVMASPNGRARVAYGTGCMLEVEPGMVVTVPQDQLCQSGFLGQGATGYVLGGMAVAAGATAVILVAKDKSASP